MQKAGNMGGCARIISHTGASNGDAVTASHMTCTKRTALKRLNMRRRGKKKGQDMPTYKNTRGYQSKYQNVKSKNSHIYFKRLSSLIMMWFVPSSLPHEQWKKHPKEQTRETEKREEILLSKNTRNTVEQKYKKYCRAKIRDNGG